MSCRLDVRKAILDKAMGDFVEGRRTFTRTAEDTFVVSNVGKAKSRSQAYAIAKNTLQRINREFSGHITGTITQKDAYSPFTVKLQPSLAYIENEYNKLPADRRSEDFPPLAPQEEAPYVMNNTSLNTDHILFAVQQEEDGKKESDLVKGLEAHKKKMLSFYKNKLTHVRNLKKNDKLTTQEILDLTNQENELEHIIYGNRSLGIEGLVNEIKSIKEVEGVNQVEKYFLADLKRVEALIDSGDLKDLTEATYIINFYKLASVFSVSQSNPLFDPHEIFDVDENEKLTANFIMDSDTMEMFREWADRMSAKMNSIEVRNKELLVKELNSNTGVQIVTNGRGVTYEDATYAHTGLKDANFIDMWLMDVNQGLVTKNGLIPQAAYGHLSDMIAKKLAWARSVEDRINQITPAVTRVLKKLGYNLNSLGILGLDGASFDLFKELTDEGHETGGYIRKFTKTFFDRQTKMERNFNHEVYKAYKSADPSQIDKKLHDAYLKMRNWRRKNTIIIEFNKMSSIINDPDFASFSSEFKPNEAAAYEKSIIDLVGQKVFEEQVTEQKAMLRKYLSERQFNIDKLLTLENKTNVNDLSPANQEALINWINSNNPSIAITDYYKFGGLRIDNRKVYNAYEYNSFVPRKYKPAFDPNERTTKTYTITDTTENLGYYDKRFEQIENDPTLSDFYYLLKEVLDTIRENLPDDIQEKLPANSVPALAQTSAEIMLSQDNGLMKSMWEGFRILWDRVRQSFGVNKQTEISYAIIDPVTKQKNYKVNDTLLRGNSEAIGNKMAIEKANFIVALGVKPAITGISRYTTVELSKLPIDALIKVAEYANVDISYADLKAGKLDAIKKVTGEAVEIGKYIRDYAVHSVVQAQSFDLPKLMKYFANVTMTYAARQQALPTIEIMRDFYNKINKPLTTVTGTEQKDGQDTKNKGNTPDGVRDNAIRQFKDWFDRAVLGNFVVKHTKKWGLDITTEVEDGEVRTKVPLFGNIIYSREERAQIKEIDKILSKGETLSKEQVDQLQDIKDKFGRERTTTAGLENLWAWIRTLALGYNIPSSLTNLMEGTVSNMILASSGEYFDPNEIYYGYHVAKLSFLKNITFGLAETRAAKKARSLVDKFRVIMDSSNELQKSTFKTFASKFDKFAPHELNRRTEYLNQMPIMIAMLRTMKIKDKEGNESSIWDAYESSGTLKEQFRTEENIENWENLTGKDYTDFKLKLNTAIVKAHGNYDELRGMMLKSYVGGKAVIMFKTWMTSQFYQRFGREQEDIHSGLKAFKGRYFSYTASTGLIHGLTVGAVVGGPVFIATVGALGFMLGYFNKTKTDVNFVQEMASTLLGIVKKGVGMPVNMLAGRKVIGTGANAFENWVKPGGKFTKQDAANMRSNMTDLAIQLTWLALTIAAKILLFGEKKKEGDDDETEEEKKARELQNSKMVAYNIITNKLVQLSHQAAMYSNIDLRDLFKSTVASNAVVQYVTEVVKFLQKSQDAMRGMDGIAGGTNSGEGAMFNQAKKIFLPGLFKEGNPLKPLFRGEIPLLGFEKFSERVFEESVWHPYFRSDAYKEAQKNEDDRARMKLNLRKANKDLPADSRLSEKDIKELVDDSLPTPAKLKKLEMTREEYEASKQP